MNPDFPEKWKKATFILRKVIKWKELHQFRYTNCEIQVTLFFLSWFYEVNIFSTSYLIKTSKGFGQLNVTQLIKHSSISLADWHWLLVPKCLLSHLWSFCLSLYRYFYYHLSFAILALLIWFLSRYLWLCRNNVTQVFVFSFFRKISKSWTESCCCQ